MDSLEDPPSLVNPRIFQLEVKPKVGDPYLSLFPLLNSLKLDDTINFAFLQSMQTHTFFLLPLLLLLSLNGKGRECQTEHRIDNFPLLIADSERTNEEEFRERKRGKGRGMSLECCNSLFEMGGKRVK